MKDSCVAVILAGGAGRRMGGGKPRKMWGEASLLARALSLAEGYADRVAIAVREPDQLGGAVSVPLLLDRADIPGPLAGLASAFTFARARGAARVQILACDMPRLPADLTLRLAAAFAPGVQVALPASNDRLHPVCGLWSTKAEPLLAEYLTLGRASLGGLATLVGEAVVDWGRIEPDPFVNLNTLAELNAQQPPRSSGLTRVKAPRGDVGQTAA